ncbi:MAG: hypothetical protein HQ523_16425 [Lentisphaerae bacterium]|nr:hypothetical protein [Lentisphaerota bacterium]
MTTVAEIRDAVLALPEVQFNDFSSWFEKYEEQRWDQQIERDQKSGPLRDLIEKARADFKASKCSRL